MAASAVDNRAKRKHVWHVLLHAGPRTEDKHCMLLKRHGNQRRVAIDFFRRKRVIFQSNWCIAQLTHVFPSSQPLGTQQLVHMLLASGSVRSRFFCLQSSFGQLQRWKPIRVPMKRRVCYKIARLPQCLWMICCRWVGSCQTIWRQTYFTMLALKTNIRTELNICTKTNTVSDHGCGLGKYLTSANLLIEKARSTGIPICIASSGCVERFRPCYHIIIVGCIDSTQQWFTMI